MRVKPEAAASAAELEVRPTGFAEIKLGIPRLYKWQSAAIEPLRFARGVKAVRQNIAVCAPNGSGKDSQIIPAAAYWWLGMHDRGKVVITSKSDLQLSEQTIPNLDKYWPKFGWKQPVKSPRYELETPTGGKLIAFVTNNAARIEGWHKEDDLTGPLLLMVNEAKTVDEDIFQGLDRCTVNALMYISSPGLKMGRFYDVFSKLRANWICIQAGLADCPHIKPDRIKFVLDTYKSDQHPIVRSTLHGEFMAQDDKVQFPVPLEALICCLQSPPKHVPGMRFGFFDFAAGRAENVFVVRDGNKYTIADSWRDHNEDAVAGRSIYAMRKAGLSAEQCAGDAAAKSILDKLAEMGWSIGRQTFGRPQGWDKTVSSQSYPSWGAMAWIEGGIKIKNREVIIPDDEILKAQLTDRQIVITDSGKLGLEDKYKMQKERGTESPDRADALFGAMAQIDYAALNPKPVFGVGGWQEEMDSRKTRDFLESCGANAGL